MNFKFSISFILLTSAISMAFAGGGTDTSGSMNGPTKAVACENAVISVSRGGHEFKIHKKSCDCHKSPNATISPWVCTATIEWTNCDLYNANTRQYEGCGMQHGDYKSANDSKSANKSAKQYEKEQCDAIKERFMNNHVDPRIHCVDPRIAIFGSCKCYIKGSEKECELEVDCSGGRHGFSDLHWNPTHYE